jgi:hypothetical protein
LSGLWDYPGSNINWGNFRYIRTIRLIQLVAYLLPKALNDILLRISDIHGCSTEEMREEERGGEVTRGEKKSEQKIREQEMKDRTEESGE